MNCHLSKREIEILDLIANEKTSREISQLLHISPDTTKSHRRNLLVKMEVKNVAGLIRKAFEIGILTY